MRLERVTFSGFRSLRDLTLELGDLTVITGPNNAGKSNLLAGLAFLSDVYARGLDAAVQTAGGYDRIAYRRGGEAVGSVSFDFEVTLEPSEIISRSILANADPSKARDRNPGVRHRFTVTADRRGPVSSYLVTANELRMSDTIHHLLVPGSEDQAAAAGDDFDQLIAAFEEATSAVLGKSVIQGVTQPVIRGFETNLRPDEPVQESLTHANNLVTSLMDAIRKSVAGVRILQPVPHLCRQPGVPGPNVLLGRYGENLPAAADHVRTVAPDAWTSTQEVMSTMMPGLLRIEIISTEDRMLALRFHERGVSRAWTAGEVSDGTIQALALVLALFDARIPLLGIEEPENSLHPWILREIVKLCTRQPGKQVVMTTHSPVLLDYAPAESVHLMWREGGQSKIGRMLDLDEDVRKVWESGETSLFELYDSGGIPQAAPGDTGDA
jgi:predicted ATPase